ncbi:hypothetical protein ACNPMX_17330 [Stenotrophomonas maltophilia]
MNTPYPTYPRLQALLGAALPGLQLSNTAAEALEDALTEVHEQAPPSAFFARLHGVAHRHGADGQAWRERQLSEGARSGTGRGDALSCRIVRLRRCVAGRTIGARDGGRGGTVSAADGGKPAACSGGVAGALVAPELLPIRANECC